MQANTLRRSSITARSAASGRCPRTRPFRAAASKVPWRPHIDSTAAKQLQRQAGQPEQQPEQQQQQQQPHQQQPCQHQQQQQQQLLQSRDGIQPCSTRRQLLVGGAATAVLPLLAPPQTAHAAAAAAPPGGTCELQESPVGLQWCDIVVGEGDLPIKGAFTKINYIAKLARSEAVFDSTYERRQPLIFKVGEHEMIEAFDVAILGAEGIPPMRAGGRRRVVAAPGPLQRQGVKSLTWVTGLLDVLEDAGEALSPDGGFNSVLEFEIELLAKRQR